MPGTIRVMCSMTMRGRPAMMPWTSKRNAPWEPASNVPMPGTSTVSSSGRRSTWVRISSTTSPSPSASDPDHPAPDAHEDLGHQHRWHLVEGLSEADQEPDCVGRVVRLVAEDLLGPDLVDAPGDAGEDERQEVERPAGVDAGDEDRRVARCARGVDALAQRGGCRGWVEQVVHRRGDDVDAGAEALLDVVEGGLGAEVARGAVGDRVGGGGQYGGGIVGGEDTGRLDAGQRSRVDPHLRRVADDDPGELELARGEYGPEGGASDVAGTPDDDAMSHDGAFPLVRPAETTTRPVGARCRPSEQHRRDGARRSGARAANR